LPTTRECNSPRSRKPLKPFSNGITSPITNPRETEREIERSDTLVFEGNNLITQQSCQLFPHSTHACI
jgi:hypothetical protein